MDILNEADAKLTAAGLSTKIVFLIYVDLLWPPLQSRLQKTDRFILMFAPISRSYTESYADIHRVKRIGPYRRNKLVFLAGVAENQLVGLLFGLPGGRDLRIAGHFRDE